MGQLIVRDERPGEAFGSLADSFAGMMDPKKAWEAQYLKERIANSQADRAKTALEIRDLQQKEKTAGVVVDEFNKLTTDPTNFGIKPMVEAPRPIPEMQGPMQEIPNPQIETANKMLPYARAVAANVMRQGGTRQDALRASMALIGQTTVLAGGVPTDQAEAARIYALNGGQLPDAGTALTEKQRVLMRQEEDAAKLKQAVNVPKGGTAIFSPQQAELFNIPKNDQGQHVISPREDGANNPYAGTSVEASQMNIIEAFNNKMRNAPDQITAEDHQRYAGAYWGRYGVERRSVDTGDGGKEEYYVDKDAPPQYAVPQGFIKSGRNIPAQVAGGPVNPPVATGGPAGTTIQPNANPSSSASPVTAPPPLNLTPQPVPAAAAGTNPNVPAPQAGAPGTATITPGKPNPAPQHMQDRNNFLSAMAKGKENMDRMFMAGFAPTIVGTVLGPLGQSSDDKDGIMGVTKMVLMNVAQGAFRPQDQEYWGHAFYFLNAVLRDESGAAVPKSEYPKYITSLIPIAGDDDATVAAKLQRQQDAIDARNNGMLLPDILAAAEGRRASGASAPRPGQAAPAQQQQSAPARPGSVEAVKEREEYNRAMQRIDQMPLAAAEKEARKAEATRRFKGGQ